MCRRHSFVPALPPGTHSFFVVSLALVLGFGFCLAPAPTAAQTSVLLVRVTDPRGPVPEATVTVLFQEAAIGRANTDADGRVQLAGLPAGTFQVRVQALGHTRRLIEGVRLAGGVHTLEVEMELAPLALEGITVRAERVAIRMENTEFSTRVDEKAIRLIPMTHVATDLVALTPGARPGHVWGGASFQANNYRIDGLSANHPGMGGDLLKPSITWIDRVEVRGLGAGAEYGGFQGGIIDLVTKRGTNDFEGSFRSTFENAALAGTNLVNTEIGAEVAGRTDIEGEARGPLIRDRLFYYVAAERIAQDRRALNHLTRLDGRFAPIQEERIENKLFAKLSWTPGPTHRLELSGAFTDVSADNYSLTGYEAAGATHKYTAPTWFFNGAFTEVLGDWGVLEARVNHFALDERFEAYDSEDVPGIRTFSLTPPYTSFGNAPFTLRSAPASTSYSAQGTFEGHTGALKHTLKVGGEYTRGTFLNRRKRNGGVTWLPTNSKRFDPSDPSTWSKVTSTWVASQWGGEVDLDADVSNAAAYAQGSLSLGPRVMVSPGLRWNQWTGWITPTSGARLQAVNDDAWDPRLGISLDLTGDGTLVAKAHWGRYHQNLISQMFDRVAGADVFTNEEFWWYTGGDLTDPTTSFTQAERDRLADEGLFRKNGEIVLNETGPVQDYKQPYVDQWLVGLEKTVGNWLKFGALYTRRTNRDMVALVDQNRATNYTRFEKVRVFDSGGSPVPFSGGSVYLQELWVPNHLILERLRCLADAGPCELHVPGFTPADTMDLPWDPDYVLTTAPDAQRKFNQVQLTMEIALPDWGASVSMVKTHLEGDLDNVSGYTDPDSYGAGPYVRVNEGVNAYGTLENFSDLEWKVSIWGDLPHQLRGGALFTYRSGDHYSPQFRLVGLGFFHYKVDTGALMQGGSAQRPGEEVDYMLLWPTEGHDVYVGPRGLPTLLGTSNLDLHVERMFQVGSRDVSLSMDMFNVFSKKAITKLNTLVNNGPDYGFTVSYSPLSPGIEPNQYYQAPQERVPPRSLRLGVAVYF